MQIFDDPRRLRLSGMAAAGADVQPQLRLLMLAEALAAPPTHRALDLSAETAVLCTAASEAVRRRPGWLYVMPSPAPLPVALPRNLWQAAVLCVLRCVLPAGRAAVTLQPGAGAAVAVFRAVSASGMPADTLPLLRRAAALTGGLCLATCSPVHGRSADAAQCRYCWMGLRYRGWLYAQHFADFIPYRTKLTKSCHWQSRTPYYNISLPSAQYTEYILLTGRC